MTDQQSLTNLIKAEAKRLGFPLVGVTLPDPPPHQDVFSRWLAQGRHATMSYLASNRSIERRANPKTILPEMRSIVVVGLPYPNPESALPQPGKGRLAAYAWGIDYHDVIPGRLVELASFIERLIGRVVSQRAYTDTGPILERDYAQQAGLGWIGKNTCLIHPRLGSYFLLGELFLDVDLEPDSPEKHDFCGSCRRCIDACPTACILPDRTLQAGRCISYLTIENKGPIPVELRPLVGDWVFGCDVCQQVCPWNIRFAHLPVEAGVFNESEDPHPELHSALIQNNEAFNRTYRGRAVMRPRRKGFVRNAAVALGNLADPAALPYLSTALESDSESLVRGHAAWALGQIGSRRARLILENALQQETDSSVIAEIRAALDRLSNA